MCVKKGVCAEGGKGDIREGVAHYMEVSGEK
jgi:hypothetical protein